jgi:DNA-directed RNA polymerase beta' subunit
MELDYSKLAQLYRLLMAANTYTKPCPPPPVRPNIAVDGGTMCSEDNLMYKLGDIIKASANVRPCEQEGAPAHIIIEVEQLLQVGMTDVTV